jgi:DNA repair protein RadC
MAKYTGLQIKTPLDAVKALADYKNRRQEHFLVLTLNGAHAIIKLHVATKGLVNRTVVSAREVFYSAIVDNAVAIIVAHNHPSGILKPSAEDDTMTRGLKKAGKLLGIRVLDHLIVSKNGYYSYKQNKRIL